MIYLMENKMPYGRIVAFKVGFTEDNHQKQREIAYRTHNPYAKIIDTAEGSKETEREYHEIMKTFCDKFNRVGRTEWFEVLDRKLIRDIETKGLEAIESLMTELVEEIASWAEE